MLTVIKPDFDPPPQCERALCHYYVGDTVLDPMAGSGTVGMMANEHGRHAILIDENESYIRLIESSTKQPGLML